MTKNKTYFNKESREYHKITVPWILWDKHLNRQAEATIESLILKVNLVDFLKWYSTPLKTNEYPMKIDAWKINFPLNTVPFEETFVHFRRRVNQSKYHRPMHPNNRKPFLHIWIPSCATSDNQNFSPSSSVYTRWSPTSYKWGFNPYINGRK